MIPKPSSRQVQSLEKAFNIISYLQNHDGSSIDTLSNEFDLAKSTIHNYLGTLQMLGYVVEREGTYHLGLRFLTHGMAAKSGLPLRETVRHAIDEAPSDLSRPIWWIVEELGRGIFVDRSSIGSNTDRFGRIGKRSYLHTHAPGKAILAHLPEEAVHEIVEYHGLEALTRETTSDVDELLDELATIREQGFAVSNGEAGLGVQSVGVAFEAPSGYTNGLGIFDYAHTVSERTQQTHLEILRATADEITASLNSGGE